MKKEYIKPTLYAVSSGASLMQTVSDNRGNGWGGESGGNIGDGGTGDSKKGLWEHMEE